jgi:hypothetical protein
MLLLYKQYAWIHSGHELNSVYSIIQPWLAAILSDPEDCTTSKHRTELPPSIGPEMDESEEHRENISTELLGGRGQALGKS